jgi:hypothetical protein
MRTLHPLKTISLAALACVTLLTSCERDEPEPSDPGTARTFTPGEGFFILNEGGFTAGNSSVSYYAMNGANAGSSFNNLYLNANGVPLGDVAQSMSLINGRIYTVVNNSSKIVVLNPMNMGATATIIGLAGPRYIMQLNANTAWISQMYSDQIAILNLSTNTVTGYIPLGVSSEAMQFTNGKVYVTSQESDKLYVVDPGNNANIDSSMTIAPGGNSMVVDGSGKLWVLAYGYWATSAAGGLYRVNTSSNTVEASMPFTTFDFPTHLCINPAGDSLFYLNYNIYRMAVTDGSLPSAGFIAGTGHAFYTIGLMPNTSNFFAGDAVDYVQSGLLYRYDAAGTQTDVDTVGVIPNNFLWY